MAQTCSIFIIAKFKSKKFYNLLLIRKEELDKKLVFLVI